MDFESLIRYKALSQRYTSANSCLVDHFIQQDGEAVEKQLGLKKVQFLVSAPLHKELQDVCGYLGMSQREFLESMLSEALTKAWSIVQAENADPESLGLTGEAH